HRIKPHRGRRRWERHRHTHNLSVVRADRVPSGTLPSKVRHDPVRRPPCCRQNHYKRAPGVGAETRKRILKLIEELDYQPNASAQSLASRRSYNIGVIIPHTGSYSMSTTYWPALLTAITEKAASQDYNVLLSTARSEQDVD